MPMMMTTCPSKVLVCHAVMSWGMRDFRVTSPFSFSAKKSGVESSFMCSIQDHQRAEVHIPERKDSENFLMMLILNKKGDNLIVLDYKDLTDKEGSVVSFEWLAPRIKRKERINVERNEH